MNDLIKTINAAAGTKLSFDSSLGMSGAVKISKRDLSKLAAILDGSADKARLSAIAMKAVATRNANKLAAKRSEAAVKANRTRKLVKNTAKNGTTFNALQPARILRAAPASMVDAAGLRQRFDNALSNLRSGSKSKTSGKALNPAQKAWITRRANALGAETNLSMKAMPVRGRNAAKVVSPGTAAALKAWKTRRAMAKIQAKSSKVGQESMARWEQGAKNMSLSPAQKAWETRRASALAAKRSNAARKAWDTRRAAA